MINDYSLMTALEIVTETSGASDRNLINERFNSSHNLCGEWFYFRVTDGPRA